MMKANIGIIEGTFDDNPSSFNTSYFCRRVLPRQLMFENLQIAYEESRMHLDMKVVGDLR
ncbi:hypothetical protein [Culicoidibacter larvae]|uniref:Uncharacterized protein n=1 Tax=Culicoidibacter larvae TaxID=2579976 RepID=A0A5R8Q8P3_9FIRM|nr:hypothetical protein [Culicoidibacter larvae]TLG71174.1 hypothetical protein FEZ08_11510 [Culicoidibacter larvae]